MENNKTPPKKRGGHRNGSGRKMMKPEERMQTMSFTLSTQQLEEIRDKAKQMGIRTSEYIRLKVFNDNEPKKTGE